MRNKEIIKLYKNPKWYNGTRIEQLKADYYECQRCKHRGKYSNLDGMIKYTKATLVHHDFRVQEYPEYVYCRFVNGIRNTYSLCNDCHEIEHEDERGLIKEYNQQVAVACRTASMIIAIAYVIATETFIQIKKF